MARRWHQRRWLEHAHRSRDQVAQVRVPTAIES